MRHAPENQPLPEHRPEQEQEEYEPGVLVFDKEGNVIGVVGPDDEVIPSAMTPIRLDRRNDPAQ